MNIPPEQASLNYVVKGEGQPVFLIHGLVSSLLEWEFLMPELVAAGYRVFAMDLLGHGDSAKLTDPKSYSVKALFGALEGWIRRMEDEENIEPPYVLVGHSLGGYMSLKYGLHCASKVRALALIDPFYSTTQLQPIFRLFHRRPYLGIKALEKISDNLIDTALGMDPIFTLNFTRQVRHQIATDVKRASPYTLNLPRTAPDLTPKLGDIGALALVVWGSRDATLNPGSFPPLVSALPNARGQPVSGCGHHPHLENPELVNRLITDFLAESI